MKKLAVLLFVMTFPALAEEDIDVKWNNYSPTVKERIDKKISNKDCSGLQSEFNAADENSSAQRMRTGESNADLMGYLDAKMHEVGCYANGEESNKLWGRDFNYNSEKNTLRKGDKDIPDYTIIDIVNTLDGSKHADVLIPSFSQKTPLETRKKVAFAIKQREKLDTLVFFSTRDAYKASYSDSFAKNNPEAYKGNLGSISPSGEFDEYVHITDAELEALILGK